jgi:mediator of RNA polymerase II transcription subunit 5
VCKALQERCNQDSSSIVLWLNKTSRIHRVGSLTTVPRQRYPSLAAVEPPVRAEVQLLRQGAIPVIQFSSQRSTRYSVCLSLSQERYDGNQNKLDQLLHRVLIYRMPSTSQETKAMHRTILGIIAEPLYHSLQSLVERKPGKKEVSALMDILKPFLGLSRPPTSNKTALNKWMSTPGGGIARCLRDAIQEQVAWVTNVGPTPPPRYTHGLCFAGCEALGVDAVLETLVTELRDQTVKGHGPYALDICTAMICAPPSCQPQPLIGLSSAQPQPQLGRPSVRDALRLWTTNPQKLLNMPAMSAEAIVRLARRVEAQLAVTQLPETALQLPIQDHATDKIMADLGLTDGDLAPTGQNGAIEQVTGLGTHLEGQFSDADLAAVLNQPMDPSATNLAAITSDTNVQIEQSQNIFGGLNMDLEQSLTQLQNPEGSNNNVDPNMEDDIFAGLDTNYMDDFGFN